MNSSNLPCDPALVRGYLDRRLAPQEDAALEQHLDRCSTCRRLLDDSAAEINWWTDASRFLAADEWDALASMASWQQVVAEEGQPAQRDDDGALRRLSAWLDPTDDPRMLGRFGGYEIVGVIGEGGMGVVLKGHETSLNRYVAIKVLAPHLASNGAARQRFSREAQAAAAVLHENVISIHRVDESQGLPYLVMPYVAGVSLQKRLDQQGPIPLAGILRIGRQVAAGLAAAHDQGLVHRDIKPANILLERGVDRVTLTDFGLARAVDDATVTRSGVIAGTPQYMSPEQARGEAVDVRSDLFSLGSVLYAMSTGRPPFRAETCYGILRRITDDEPRPIREINPEIPEWLEGIVRRLHAKAPANRFQTPAEVAELLESCLAHVHQPTLVPLPDGAASLVVPAVRDIARRRRRIGIIALFGIAATLIVALAVTSWPKREEASTHEPDSDVRFERTAAARRDDWDDIVGPELDGIGIDLTNLNAELQSDTEPDTE
jgi:serine/threonine-protein kinase